MDLDFLDAPAERDPHPSQLAEADLLDQCEMSRGRSGGPGGQHRNKVETQVTYTHTPTGISAQAGERRSPEVNRKMAIKRLRLRLATEHRADVPAGDVRSELWRSRTRGGRIACSVKHADYPAMLAEAMDVVAASGWDHAQAAVRLEVTPSQLVRLIGDHAPAKARLNEERASRGMRALR